MPAPTRPWLLGLTLGFLAAAALTAMLGPGLPALAQSGRAGAIAPALEPFRADGILSLEADSPSSGVDLTPSVPPGKLLVVESVFASALLPPGEQASVRVGPLDDEVPIPMLFQGTTAAGVDSVDLYVNAVASLRLHVPSGPVRGRLERLNPSVVAAGRFTVVGHLVPAP